MPNMPIQFTPNPEFSDHVMSIQASNGDQGPEEIHSRLVEEVPGADVSPADVADELATQQQSRPGRDRHAARVLAFLFEDDDEEEELRDCARIEADIEARLFGRRRDDDDDDDDDSTLAPSDSLAGTTCVGEEVVTLTRPSVGVEQGGRLVLSDAADFVEANNQIIAYYTRLIEQLRLSEDQPADRFSLAELTEAEGWSADDDSSIAPSESISCADWTLAVEGQAHSESSSPSDAARNPFEDPEHQVSRDHFE